jgi:uncharacterized protein YcbK (DUF882 family)
MAMMLSKNFSTVEWECRCGCGQCIVEPALVNMMQSFRDLVKKQVVVHCVNRCPKHNEEVGGVLGSYHTLGQACDFHVKGFTIPELHSVALTSEDIFIGGIGIYDTFVHVDIGKKRQWDNRKHA